MHFFRDFGSNGADSAKAPCSNLKPRNERKEQTDKMNRESRNMKLANCLASVVLAGWLLAGCSQTAAPEPNLIQRAQGETPAPPPPSGFLGSDYSLMTPPA